MQKCFYHHHLLNNWSLPDFVLSAQVTKMSLNLDLCSKEPFSSSGRLNMAQKYPLQQEDQGPHQVGATVVSILGILKRGDIEPPGGNRSLDVKEEAIQAKERRAKTKGTERLWRVCLASGFCRDQDNFLSPSLSF